MTDKEVIKGLQAVNEHIGKHFNEGGAWMAEFIDNAIKLLEQQPITWIVGIDNCQVAVRNMPIDKMQKICAIIGEEEPQPCEDVISIESVIEWLKDKDIIKMKNQEENARRELAELPSVAPSYNSVKTELKPSEDYISREDAKNLFWDGTEGYDCRGFTRMEIGEMLDDLPSVQPQQGWIPVSERLPEEDGDYLLFGKVVEDEDTEYIFIGMYDACAEKFGFWEDYYDGNTLGFLDSELIEYNKVIAWMPLPQPYKEGEEK